MILVDTNVVAYLLVDGDQSTAARELQTRDPDWRSEAFLLVEFTNVLASMVVTKRTTPSSAEALLDGALALFDGKLTRAPHAMVLALAVRYRVSAYDARFLAVADQLGQRLVTEDRKLRSAAPSLTQSLREAVSGTHDG